MWDVDPEWQLRLDLSATRAAGSATGSTYVGSLSAVFLARRALEPAVQRRRIPRGRQRCVVQVPIDDVNPDAQLHATASWVVLGVGVDYNSASRDMHSVSASLAVNETYFRTHQEVLGVQDWTSPGGGKLSQPTR